MMTKPVHFTIILLFVLLILDTLTLSTRAQFFTKTSKSIPRMGRRADNFLLEEDDLTDDASLSADSAEHQSQEPRSGSRESNAQPLKSFMSSLVEIPKFIQDSVLFYERKLRKRVK